MNTTKHEATPTGRRYASVSDMLVKEKASREVCEQTAKLNARSVVARRLASVRAKAGMTQAELAKKIGCSQGRISKIEASMDEDITLGVIREYMKATESSLTLVCGKPVSHVQAIKNHAFSIRRHLTALAQIAHKNEELEPHIQGFFGEAFLNILEILSECQDQMPKATGDFEMRVSCEPPGAPQSTGIVAHANHG